MEYCKRQVFERLWEILKELNAEELSVLYKSEFARGFEGYRHVKTAGDKLFYMDDNSEAGLTEIMQFIVKSLNRNNQNHKLVVVYNSVQDRERLKYSGNGRFTTE
ncbi:MAG: hypothetical protein JXA66_05540 [Oligoflexia bacterium]|nr:hypothetical protein [Oligoflexia bacterium]